MNEIDEEARVAAKEADGLQARYAEYVIHTHTDYILAGDALKEIKRRMKRLDELRRKMTRPLDESKAVILSFFRGPEGALGKAEAAVKGAMLVFQKARDREWEREREREREEKARLAKETAEAKVMELAEAGDVEGVMEMMGEKPELEPLPIPMPVPQVVPKVEGVSTRKMWKWEVLDAGMIPREYMVVDVGMVTRVVQASKGRVEIPGVRVWQEEIMVGRMG